MPTACTPVRVYTLNPLHNAQALPDTEAEVQARLRELHLELEPLREQKRSIDGRVQRCSCPVNP